MTAVLLQLCLLLTLTEVFICLRLRDMWHLLVMQYVGNWLVLLMMAETG